MIVNGGHTTRSKACAVDSEVGESTDMVTVVFDNHSARLSCAQTDWSTTKLCRKVEPGFNYGAQQIENHGIDP